MQKKNISNYLSLSNLIADKVAIELIKSYKKKKTIIFNEKKIINQVVTKIDYKVERIARKLIQLNFPDHNILGEEFKKINNNSDYTWIIDPIDGTKAFITGIPVFTFMISLMFKNEFIFGLVDQPILKERFWHNKEKSYLNDKEIKVSKNSNISNSIVAITDPLMFKNYNIFNKKILKKFSFVRWGTDAIGYMRLAEGIIDAVVERNLKIWDIAAAVPIIKLAGGIITTWDNKKVGTNDTILACSTRKMHKVLVNTLQKHI